MKTILLSLTFSLMLVTASTAQFGKLKNKFKQQVESLIDKGEEKGEELAQEQKLKLYEAEQIKQLVKDTTYYNYSFAQAEKVSYFTSRDDNQSALLALSKFNNDKNFAKPELKPYQQAFDHNRSGSNAIAINRVISLYNFTEALTIYFGESITEHLILNYGKTSLETFLSQLTSDTLTRNDYYAVGKSLTNISMLYQNKGLYSVSKKINESLLVFTQEKIGKESLLMASVYNNQSLIALSNGNYNIAEELMNKSISILIERKSELRLDLAVLYNNQAMLYQQTGQYKKAISKIDEALIIAEDRLNNKAADYSKLKLNKSLILKGQKNYEQAEELLLDLKKTKENRFGKGHQDYADIQSILASLYMEMGKTELVEPLLLNALEIYEKKYSKEHQTYTSTLQSLGVYYLSIDQYDNSREVLENAKRLINDGFGSKHPDYLKVIEHLAVLSWNEGNNEQAKNDFLEVCHAQLDLVEKFFPSMSENEKSKFWNKNQNIFLKFYAFVSENHKAFPSLLTEMYNIQLATKGILLSTTSKVRQQILSGDNQELKDEYTKWVQSKEQLASAYTLSKQQLKEQKINIDSLEQTANAQEKELGKKSAAFANVNTLRSISADDIIKKLSSDQVAIEIIRFPKFKKSFSSEIQYVYLVVNDDGKIKISIKENGDDLETKYASRYRKSIQYQIEDDNSYGQYWSFLNDHLIGKTKIYLSLEGIYNQINVNTLKQSEGIYLGDKFDIISLSSTRDIVSVTISNAPAKSMVLFGNPDYGEGGNIAALPGTKLELEKISSLVTKKGIQAKTYLNSEASEGRIKSEAKNAEVVHIATHGFFLNDMAKDEGVVFGVEINQARENPLLRSGLMLANAGKTIENIDVKEVSSSDNGILTAYEVMNMDMNKTKLVVLSACETGLGEIRSGEGVYGLQRAFQLAGVETIIMSLWKVNDTATQQLMTSFYSEWTKSGDKHAAFKLAQKNLRIQYKQPYYWGAFVMMN
jgi:CHAT domain-containing protein